MRAESLDIGAALDAVPVSRQFAVRVLAGVDQHVTDAAELVVSELVTNALLHAGPPVVVRVADLGDGDVRLEVHDTGRTLPVRPLADGGGMTGRGLALVDALASRWGVEPLHDGKVVWAELSARSVAEAQPGDLDHDQLLAAYVEWPTDPGHRLFRISLGDVPTDLLLNAKAHVDSVIRELVLSANGAASGLTAALPAHLADLIHSVVTEFSDARQAIKRQALAAAERGDARTTLELSLPLEAADAGERYLKALSEADSYARASRLLTLASPAQHQAFRRWYVTSLVEALRSAAAGESFAVQTSFESHLLRQVDELAELQRVSERAARLQRVTASLAAALTVEAVARIALDDAVAELQGDRGSFMFPVQGRMRAVAVIGYDPEGVTQLERRWAEGQLTPTLHAYRTGAGVWVETADERDAQFPSLSGSEPGVVATCAVPMLVAEHTVGVFRVSFLESRLFTDDERSFAEALGAVAAQALERVSLYDEKARTADRLTRLQSVSAALARTRSLAEALDVTIRHATGLVGAQVASVSLLDADDQRTIRLLRVEPPTETSAAWSTYDVGDALPTSEAIRTGAIVTAESVAERDARWPAMSMVDWGFDHSLLVLPLHVEDTSVGALTLSFAKQAAGEEPDQAFLMAFADACAQALERARAAERAAIANRRLRLLARASSQLAASLDIERTLASVARLVVPEIADWCVVHLLVNGELTAVASEHSDPLKRQLALEVQQRFPERLSDEGGVGEVVRTGRSKLIPDIAEIPVDQFVERHPEHTAVIAELGLSSVIIVPLLARGRTLGSITLIAAESGQRYTQADVEFAEEIAARAAVAIDNANLFTGNAAVAAHRLLDGSMGDDAEAVSLVPVAPQRADSVAVTPEGRNELARLLETMTDAFFRLDREWRFTYINSQAERLLFRSRNELLGTKIWEQYPDAIGSQFDEKYSSALATGQAVAFEEFFVPLDTWFEVRAMPDAGGLSVFFHDVSTRKRAEDARALASERLALLGEATRGLVGTLDITTVL
ncbi:MAG: hypothetical protein QOG52_431, partial [Frankiaceae bacterium]|nr:hypothetical protein [Frankiaceae bacterium]